MPSRAITPTPKTYAQLRDAVTAVIVTGRLAIDRAWVDTCHETGRLINEHVLLFRERADYGTRVYEKLAEDTKVSVRTLRECAQFQRYFPIRRNCAELGWSQCRLLCQVADETERLKLLKQAVKNDWTVPELEIRVRSYNAVALASDDAAPAPAVELLTPRRGTPGLCRVVERSPSTSLRAGGGLGIDLGFKNYADLPSGKWKAGDIVRWDESGPRKIAAAAAELFTYRATIRKIIDGDTLDVAITLAPGFTRDLKLRLRGLDCPELSTAAGRAAKVFVEKLIRPGDEVIISTTKPDKYDRYLADVFLVSSSDQSSDLSVEAFATPEASAKEATFLNNALLEAGHAVRYDGGAKEE